MVPIALASATSSWNGVVLRKMSTGVVSHHSRAWPSLRSDSSIIAGSGDDAVGEQRQDLVSSFGSHEDVDVEIDRASRLLRAPCERERAAEGVVDARGA